MNEILALTHRTEHTKDFTMNEYLKSFKFTTRVASSVLFFIINACGSPHAKTPASEAVISPIDTTESSFSLEGHFETVGSSSLKFSGKWLVWATDVTPQTLATVNAKAGMVEALSLQSLKYIAETILPASESFGKAQQSLRETPSQETKMAAIAAAKNAQNALSQLDTRICAQNPDALVCRKSESEKSLMLELLSPETTQAMLRTTVELMWNKDLRNVVGTFQVFEHKNAGLNDTESFETFDFCVKDLDQDAGDRYDACLLTLKNPAHVTAFLKRESDLVKLVISANLGELFAGKFPTVSTRDKSVVFGSFSEIEPKFIRQSTLTASLEIVRTPLYRGLKGDIILTSTEGENSRFGSVNLSEDNPLPRAALKLAQDLKDFAGAAAN